MRSDLRPAAPPEPAATRMIWLPGAYNTAEDFVRAGFAAAVSSRGLALDLEFLDPELRYLGDRGVLEELRTTVISPLRAAGVMVWLAGISLGGSLALDFAASYEGDLAGLCLLAPYPGNRMLIQEIERAPGLSNWQAGALAETDAERRIWRYIKTRVDSAKLFLGYGKGDRFSAAHEMLAATLPADWVEVVAGGHEWGPWLKLWENFLDSHFR